MSAPRDPLSRAERKLAEDRADRDQRRRERAEVQAAREADVAELAVQFRRRLDGLGDPGLRWISNKQRGFKLLNFNTALLLDGSWVVHRSELLPDKSWPVTRPTQSIDILGGVCAEHLEALTNHRDLVEKAWRHSRDTELECCVKRFAHLNRGLRPERRGNSEWVLTKLGRVRFLARIDNEGVVTITDRRRRVIERSVWGPAMIESYDPRLARGR